MTGYIQESTTYLQQSTHYIQQTTLSYSNPRLSYTDRQVSYSSLDTNSPPFPVLPYILDILQDSRPLPTLLYSETNKSKLKIISVYYHGRQLHVQMYLKTTVKYKIRQSEQQKTSVCVTYLFRHRHTVTTTTTTLYVCFRTNRCWVVSEEF